MFPSYQTVPLANVPTKANVPKDERSSTPVPRMKKVAVAALFGMALVVVCYSYGSNTHPAMMIDIATTTTTAAAAANLVRGSVSNGDACYDIEAGNETACKGREGCYWYPHWGSTHGFCSSSPGVECGGYRARDCRACPYYDSINNQGKEYCQGDCEWDIGWPWEGQWCTHK